MNRLMIRGLSLALALVALATVGCMGQASTSSVEESEEDVVNGGESNTIDDRNRLAHGTLDDLHTNSSSSTVRQNEVRFGPQPDPWRGNSQANGPQPDPWQATPSPTGTPSTPSSGSSDPKPK